MTETQFRAALVAEAESWLNTPYMLTGPIKGVGTNCARFLFAVGKVVGVIPAGAEPEWYAPQMAAHSSEEKLISNIVKYGGVEVFEPKPGDVIVFRTGKAYGHAGLVIDYPTRIIHALAPNPVSYGHAFEGRLGRLQRRFFTFWHGGAS